MRTLNGAWTYSWQGEKTEKFAQKHNTIYESISNIYGKKNVKFVSGVEYPFNADFDKEPKFQYYDQNEKNFNKAISEAKKSDVIILCLGENTYTEKPGDLNDLNLHRLQKKLAIKLAETGKPIILIINSGRPRLITDIEPLMASVVNIYLPGNYGGDALADIISGKVNPSGKLPYTYPLFPNSLTTYNYKPAEIQNNSQGAYNYVGEINSLYEFGFGLSYTNFKYENLKLNDSIFNKNENIEISIKVTNIGKRTGKETIQLYSKDHYASLTPDIKRLRRFKKIELSPGESKVVNFKLPVSELSFINEKNISIVEPGNFDLIISNLNKIIEVK
jgi:beta-glucosidase